MYGVALSNARTSAFAHVAIRLQLLIALTATVVCKVLLSEIRVSRRRYTSRKRSSVMRQGAIMQH